MNFNQQYDDFDILPSDPVIIPPPPPIIIDDDPAGSVIGSDGSSSNAQSEIYQISGILSLAWAQEPYRVLWAARSDGLLLGMTYRRDQGVLAWHRHPMGNSGVECVATIPDAETGRAQLWVSVLRVIGDETVRYVERMLEPHDPVSDTDTDDYCFLDSSLTYRGDPVSVIEGLGHLEGQEVSIWADGARHPDRIVEDGSVTLDREASVIHVGIHTPSYLVSLPIEDAGDYGTGQGRKKNISAVRMRLHNTIGGKAGRGSNALDDIVIRSETDLMDTTPGLRSGVYETNVKNNSDVDGQFIVVQDFPAPMTVLSLVPKLTEANY